MTDSTKNSKVLKDRDFGLIFSAIFIVIGFWPMLFGEPLRYWSLIVATLFAVPAIFFSRVLNPLNKLWAQFGQVMHKIVNPILMGLVFFLTVLPTGLVLKLLGKDPMHRKFDSNADTYWICRDPGSLSKESFDNQF